MVDDQEDKVVDIRQMLEMMHEMGDQIEAGLIATGIDPVIARHFACLRFHPMHPWGLAYVIYQGKSRLAIVRGSDDGSEVFLMALLTMQGDDIRSANGIEIDEYGCMPMTAFPRVPTTKH